MMLKGELFSTDMVRAYLDGRKLHTARPIKPVMMEFEDGNRLPFETAEDRGDGTAVLRYRNFRVPVTAKHRLGDYIYCRETCWKGYDGNYHFKANYLYGTSQLGRDIKVIPSIHMPREAARLFFRVTKVEVMRLDDVTEEFAREDGFGRTTARCNQKTGTCITLPQGPLENFIQFWLDTYGPDARWMWVYWTEPVSEVKSQ